MNLKTLLYSLLVSTYASALYAASFDELNLDSLELMSESNDIQIYIKPGIDLSEYKPHLADGACLLLINQSVLV